MATQLLMTTMHASYLSPNRNMCTNTYVLIIAYITVSLYVTKHFTHKNIRYHKHKHKKSSWITPGIIHSIGFRDKMYRRLKQTPSNSIEFITLKINLRTYNRILKRQSCWQVINLRVKSSLKSFSSSPSQVSSHP